MWIHGAAFLNQSLKIQEDWNPESGAEKIIGELQELSARRNAGEEISGLLWRPFRQRRMFR